MSAPSTTPLGEQTSHSEAPLPSGRLLLRMPPGLHRELAQAAEQEGTSLNAYIIARLKDSVGARAPAGADERPSPSQSAKTLTWLLTANVVAVALAALAALAILLVAWLG